MWCPLPWSHVGIKNNGTLRMCSHSQSAGINTVLKTNDIPLTIADLSKDVLNCDTLKSVRKDIIAGRWPEQCRRCEIESLANSNSRNNWETDKHSNYFTEQDARKNTLDDGTLINSEKFYSFDLRIGNQCNLRCTMCFPGEAHKWYDDYQEIMGTDTFTVDGNVYSVNESKGIFDWAKQTDNVQDLISISKHLRKIKFGGGEPIILKHHRDLLKGLIDAGYASQIELEYSINLTMIPPDIFKMWEHFRKIILCASIDAYGIANEAIRYPTKWDKVETNLDMLDNTDDKISIFTSTTISILSLEHYADLMLWIEAKNFKKINKFLEHPNFATHPVYNPKYLNIGILEQFQLDSILDILYNKVKHNELFTSKIYYYEELYKSIKVIDDVEYHRKCFAKRFDKFQKNQKQDWNLIFPEAALVADEWKQRYLNKE
jgi:sulfatase maturation enzyme AslB (radical SAM superfamily)